MKKNILILVALTLALSGFAQKQGAFRVGFDGGIAIPRGGMGVLASAEPKYNIADNMNVGLRVGLAAMAKEIVFTNSNEASEAETSANLSTLLTFDYYLNKGGRSAFYVGAGAGYYVLGNVKLDFLNQADEITSLNITNKPGGLVRAGFESGKFRMGMEYNLIPETELYSVSGKVIGTSRNSYLGLHLGFFVGGGRWGR
jgi:outer membrane protein X